MLENYQTADTICEMETGQIYRPDSNTEMHLVESLLSEKNFNLDTGYWIGYMLEKVNSKKFPPKIGFGKTI